VPSRNAFEIQYANYLVHDEVGHMVGVKFVGHCCPQVVMVALGKVAFSCAPQLGIRALDEGELTQITFWKAIVAEFVAVS
jgi:hypothetical protein